MTAITKHDLGTYYETHHDEADFCSWIVATYTCPSCNSALAATYVDSMGRSTSDKDPVTCPVCGDRSVIINAATHPAVAVLCNGKIRISEDDVDW